MAYTIEDVSEYKEDIRKLSQGTGNTAIFFRLLSDRIAIQDNFESYEGSLMPYLLDKDLAKVTSDALSSFTKMSESQRKLLAQDFLTKFKRIQETRTYLGVQREVEPGAKSKSNVTIGDLTYSLTKSVTIDENSRYVASLLVNPEESLSLDIKFSKSGEVVELDPKATPKIHREYGIEVGAKSDLAVKEEALENTVLTDEEILDAIKKCNIA
jgi:hypothetical protein